MHHASTPRRVASTGLTIHKKDCSSLTVRQDLLPFRLYAYVFWFFLDAVQSITDEMGIAWNWGYNLHFFSETVF